MIWLVIGGMAVTGIMLVLTGWEIWTYILFALMVVCCLYLLAGAVLPYVKRGARRGNHRRGREQ